MFVCAVKDDSQQRVCSGFSPDSLLPHPEGEPITAAKLVKNDKNEK
jgi:hypothetical protein